MATTKHSDVKSTRINPLAVVSVFAGIFAVGGMVGMGTVVPAAFAAGAGHVSLHQMRDRGGRGRTLALTGLVIGYAVATWALVLTLTYIPALASAL